MTSASRQYVFPGIIGRHDGVVYHLVPPVQLEGNGQIVEDCKEIQKVIFLACLLIMLPLAGCPDCTVAVEAVAVTGAFSVISIASSGPAVAAAAPLVAVT